MAIESIFTLDARDNILLEFIKSYFSMDDKQINSEINNTLQYVISILKRKGINYQELKSALVPSEKNEIALIFDTKQIESSWYGLPVMSAVLPLFDKNSSHSVLVGDYIGKNDMIRRLHSEFFENIKTLKQINYQHHSQFYIVYINNMSNKMVETFNNRLNSFTPYVGYFDLTYSSFLKTYMSTILVRLFLKSRKIIIQGHEDDVENDNDINMSGYPFNEFGYTCKSIQSMYYDLFLSYKIERQVFDGFESDTTFALNSITENVFDINNFNLHVEESKMKHLLSVKRDNFERTGIANLTTREVEKLIKDKINSNYLYNLTFNKDHGTLKFNIIIETKRTDNNNPYKLTVALEYKPFNRTLRLITMF